MRSRARLQHPDELHGWNGEIIKGSAHHGGTEVWVDALHRIHYQSDGVPLSLCEVRQAAFEKQIEGVNIVIGPQREHVPMSADISAEAGHESRWLYREGKLPGPHPVSGMYFWIGAVMTNACFANLYHNPESFYRVLLFRDRHNDGKARVQPRPPARTSPTSK